MIESQYLYLYSHDSFALQESFTDSSYKIKLLVSELNRGRINEAYWVDIEITEDKVKISSTEDPSLSYEFSSCLLSPKMASFTNSRGFGVKLLGQDINTYDQYYVPATGWTFRYRKAELLLEKGLRFDIFPFTRDSFLKEKLSIAIYTRNHEEVNFVGEWSWNTLLSLDSTQVQMDPGMIEIIASPEELSLDVNNDFVVFLIYNGDVFQKIEFTQEI